jgi:uncharacterized protein (DUF4415 family)
MKQSSRTDLSRIKKMKDSSIDYSDISETDEMFWADAEIIFPNKKIHLSIRLDNDIIEWFKQYGSGYQTKINSVLRSYINTVRKKKRTGINII